MDGKPVLTDGHARLEPAFDHPPADSALQPAEREQQNHARPLPARDRAGGPKHQEWEQENDSQQSPEQTMRPLPPKDRLKRLERHPAVFQPVLRNLLVFGESRLPRLVRERRDDTGYRLPFGDRKS